MGVVFLCLLSWNKSVERSKTTLLTQALSRNFFQSSMTLVGSQNQTRSQQIISIWQIHLSTDFWAWVAAENCVHTGGVNWICTAVRNAVTSEWQVHIRWFARILWANNLSFRVSWSFEAWSVNFCVFWSFQKKQRIFGPFNGPFNGPGFSCHLMTALWESSPWFGGRFRAFHSDFTHFRNLPP